MRAPINSAADYWPALLPPRPLPPASPPPTSTDWSRPARRPSASLPATPVGFPKSPATRRGAAVRTAFSTAFNNAVQGTLSGYAANGVIVHYLDLSRVLDNIAANPAAYGITSGLVCPALPNPTCVVNSTGYLFYADQLHLTSDGFAIVARYVAAQLDAPLTLQGPSEAGMNVGQQFGRTLTGAARPRRPARRRHARGLGRLYRRRQPIRARSTAAAATSRSTATASASPSGSEYGFGSGVVGVAGNYSRPKTNFDSGAADVKSRSAQLGVYAGFGIGGAFAQGYLGYGWDSHDIDRRGVVENMSASPDGNHWVAGAKAGYLMGLGAVRDRPGRRARLCPRPGRRLHRGRRPRADAQRRLGPLQQLARQPGRRDPRRLRRWRDPASPVCGAGRGKGIVGRQPRCQLLADLGPDHRQQFRLRECLAQDLWPRHDRRLGADLPRHSTSTPASR